MGKYIPGKGNKVCKVLVMRTKMENWDRGEEFCEKREKEGRHLFTEGHLSNVGAFRPIQRVTDIR